MTSDWRTRLAARGARLDAGRVTIVAAGIDVHVGTLDPGSPWIEVVASAGDLPHARVSRLLEVNLDLPVGVICWEGAELVVRQTVHHAQEGQLEQIIDAVARLTGEARDHWSR